MKKTSMVSRGIIPVLTIPINDSYILGIYKGNLSEYDILLKYRQKDPLSKSGWSRIRTPKHIHWAVDILLKIQSEEKETKKLLNFLVELWDEKIKPIKSEDDRARVFNVESLLEEVNLESGNYKKLANKGEYSIKFLILIAKLLMIQEKTNFEAAYMFRQLLEALQGAKDIYKIVSIATHR